MNILVTGAAGFIGASLALRLLRDGHRVSGIDNLSDYYDVGLKQARLARLGPHPGFHFEQFDLADAAAVAQSFAKHRFDAVVHLAAQPGVRYSMENPAAYIDSNLVAFGHVLEQARQHHVGHLVFASSSSVYGANHRLPFSEHDPVDHPISLYAATKRANELLAHSYAHLFALPCTGLRFFTVYGPWMRPDMALYKFAERMVEGRAIQLHNRGEMQRDFTYIDDIVESMVRLIGLPPQPDPRWKDQQDPARSSAPYRIFNIGCEQPVHLMELIRLLEQALKCEAVIEMVPIQGGEMIATAADVSDLTAAIGYTPATPLAAGVGRFVEWFLDYRSQAPREEKRARPARGHRG